MNHEQFIEWLFENGGAVVGWRTATELRQPVPASQLERISATWFSPKIYTSIVGSCATTHPGVPLV